MHVYDWIDSPADSQAEAEAKAWMDRFTQSPVSTEERTARHAWLTERIVTCQYQGKTYRCTGCSRLGDVWLTSDMSQELGYEQRVDVADCTEWWVKTK